MKRIVLAVVTAAAVSTAVPANAGLVQSMNNQNNVDSAVMAGVTWTVKLVPTALVSLVDIVRGGPGFSPAATLPTGGR